MSIFRKERKKKGVTSSDNDYPCNKPEGVEDNPIVEDIILENIIANDDILDNVIDSIPDSTFDGGGGDFGGGGSSGDF